MRDWRSADRVFSLVLVGLLLMAVPTHAQDPRSTSLAELLTAYHEAGYFDGTVLVADSSGVIYRHGFGLANREWNVELEPEASLAVGSLAKLFTAILTLQLVDEGLLKLDDDAGSYLDNIPVDTRPVTIHQLLSHTSGLPGYYDRDFFENHRFVPYDRSEFFGKFCAVAPEAEPGSVTLYSTVNYCLLGAIIESATGASFEQQMIARILEPIGATGTGLDLFNRIVQHKASGYLRGLSGYSIANPEYPDSHSYGGGGIYTSVDDLYQLDRGLRSDALLTPTSREALATPYGDQSFREGYRVGYGGTIASLPIGPDMQMRTLHHSGGNTAAGFTSSFTRVLEDGLVVVLLTNAGPGWFDETVHEISAAILDILYGRKFELPRLPAERELYLSILSTGTLRLAAKLEALKQDDRVVITQRGLYALGSELLNQLRFQEALDVFRLLVNEYPDSSWSYNGLGEAHEAAGDLNEARALFERALAINPDNEQAVGNLARLTASGSE